MTQINALSQLDRNKDRKRVGRGSAAGGGKTAGRGNKGQKARTGGSIPAYFEGGQVPFIRRLKKKRGFKSHRNFTWFRISLDHLADFATDGVVSLETLASSQRLKPRTRVKILGNGEVTAAYTVKVNAVSAAARSKIEAAGGTIEIV